MNIGKSFQINVSCRANCQQVQCNQADDES